MAGCEVSYNRNQTVTTTVTLHRCTAMVQRCMYIDRYTGRNEALLDLTAQSPHRVNTYLIPACLCVLTDDSSPAKDNCVDMCNVSFDQRKRTLLLLAHCHCTASFEIKCMEELFICFCMPSLVQHLTAVVCGDGRVCCLHPRPCRHT